MHGEKPDLSNLPEWGSRVSVHDPNGTKLDGRAKEGRWVGFDPNSKGHRIYWPEKRTVTVERNLTFIPVTVRLEEESGDESVDKTQVTHPVPNSPYLPHTFAPTITYPSA